MRKHIIRIITISVISVLCLSFVSCSFVQESINDSHLNSSFSDFEVSKNESAIEKAASVLKPDHGIKLVSSETTYDINYTAQTLIATVTPASAFVKDVVWSIAWESDDQTNAIENYYAVIPSYEGSNVAEVRCFAEPEFENATAVVTVTTVDGGYTANCRVIFRGKPSSINLTGRNVDQDDDGNYIVGTDEWKNYQFDIQYSNPQNSVNSEYTSTTFEVISFTGNVRAADAVEDSDGEITFYSDTEKTIPIDTYLRCFDINIDNSVLTIKYDITGMSEDSEFGSSDETYYTNHFRSFIDGEEYVMTLKITNNTGLSSMISLKFISLVNGVALNNNVIYF